MKIEQAKQIANKAVEQLSQALEQGQSETLKTYLAAIGRFRKYSFRNVMMIASQKPTASYVAGLSRMADTRTIREERRTRHRDTCSDRSREEVKHGTR